MFSFNEELLQFIWRHKLLKPVPLITRSGNELFIIKPGELNLDAGPDFFNAQIRIHNLVLAGNIELHMRTSDWLRHQHQKNKSYDTIILHAVYEHDTELDQNTKHNVEVLELKDLIDPATIANYEALVSTKTALPCARQLKNVSDLKFLSWMERMTVERLEVKVDRIEQLFHAFGGDYTQTFYACLLRSFGFQVNAQPFELLAKQLPVHLVLKHADSLFQLEALFIGMSGFLDEQLEDKYLLRLQNEFEHLKNKYKLLPLQKELFKFSRMRPANFPTVRLAQLAALIHADPALIGSPQLRTSYKDLLQALRVSPGPYWKNHYKPGTKAVEKELSLGEDAAEKIMVNAFAPFFFFYAKKLARPEYTEATITLLNACKMEVNAKTKLFNAQKEKLINAAGSQAAIHLYDNYCTARKCLKCGIAAALLNPVELL